MSSLGIAVAALGSSIPNETIGLALSRSVTDVMAVLGALAVATLVGLLLRQLRQLESPDRVEPAKSPNPHGNDLKQAA